MATPLAKTRDRVALAQHANRLSDAGKFLNDLVAKRGQPHDRADDDDRGYLRQFGRNDETSLIIPEFAEQRMEMRSGVIFMDILRKTKRHDLPR